MIKKDKKRTEKLQSGSISLLIVLVVVMSFTLCMGVVAVAEGNAHTRFVQHAVQSTANAAAFSYAQEYVKDVKTCIKQKIIDQSDQAEGENFPNSTCELSKVVECAESDFKTCTLDLPACFEETDSPLIECQSDAEVLAMSESTAVQKAKKIATKYQLEKVRISRENEKYIVIGSGSLNSKIPQFGAQKVDTYQAESNIIISKR